MNNPEAFADYLAEKPPFLKLPRHPFTRTGDTLSIPLGQACEYRGPDFTDLMLQTGTMGALNLALGRTGKDAGYIMMERMHIMRSGNCRLDELLRAKIKTTLLSARKGSALAHIINDREEIIYSMNTGYHIFSKADFEQLFSAHKRDDLQGIAQDTSMPVVELQPSGDDRAYRMQIGPFTYAHCVGHFPGYPCVPASFIMRSLLTGIARWLQLKPDQLLIDNAEIFTTRMIPVASVLSAATRIIHTSRRSSKFIVTLEDTTDPTRIYGYYIIDIRETSF